MPSDVTNGAYGSGEVTLKVCSSMASNVRVSPPFCVHAGLVGFSSSLWSMCSTQNMMSAVVNGATVGPLVSFTEGEGELGGVVVLGPRLCDVRLRDLSGDFIEEEVVL